MTNAKQSVARKTKRHKKDEATMKINFPDVPENMLWNRKKNVGFTTIPRTMPIIMQAIDAQTKGHPAGHTLFCLWARAFDTPVISIESQETFAYETGFSGGRAVHTWRMRMKALRELRMIETRKGPSGEFHYILLLNPNLALKRMREEKKVNDNLYDRFVNRLLDIGAHKEIENAD